MKKMFFIAAMLFAAHTASAQEIRAFQYEDAIQVNGKAEKKVTPDEIWVAITLKDTDNRNRTVAESEARMKREFAALGIDIEKALKVTGMANAPRKRNQMDASRSYELKVGDAATLAPVFEV
jgi:uncharacterized protein YggE